MSATPKGKKKEAYKKIIVEVFKNHYSTNKTRFIIARPELVAAAAKYGLKVTEDDDEESAAKNIGDVIYTFRFRRQFQRNSGHCPSRKNVDYRRGG